MHFTIMTSFLDRSTPQDAEKHRLAWAVLPADLHTPVRIFLALRDAGRGPCLLESAEGPDRLARYSFFGIDSDQVFKGSFSGASLETAEGKEDWEGACHDAFSEVLARMVAPPAPSHLPPFCGGWVGAFSYEWATTLEPRVPVPGNDPWGFPAAEFRRYPAVVALDHSSQRILLVRDCPDGEAGFTSVQESLDSIASDLARPALSTGSFRTLGEIKPAMDRGAYEEGVARIRHDITQGEIFQAVLSQRFDLDCEGDPFLLYRALRLTNPSPHMFYWEGEETTLVGSSPERLVSVLDGRIQNRPIAGTRARSEDPLEDERLAAELLGDTKERAEHDMLVDLARNDLGRVARTGTVSVREHSVIEKFARVQHLVSRVECDLAAGRGALDALAACFPAGTVSGAPKVRAMEILAEIEKDARGPYAGAFGYVDRSGNLDMAITIRTFALKGNRLSFQAGAGVVFDSNPEREYEETLEKSGALVEAATLAGSGDLEDSGQEGKP